MEMSKKEQQVPTIRFKGFTETWEQRKVRELFTVTRGQVLAATRTKEKETNNFIYPVYSSQTKNNGLMGFYDQYLFEDAITWTTDGANAGTVNFRKGKFYSTNVNGVLLSDEGFANNAVAEIINKIAWKHVSKVGNPKLMNNVMAEITVAVPSIEEQNKLSSLFRQLDNTIALHQRHLRNYKEFKKVMLQKIFSQEGEKVPEVRFDSFVEEWEQRKLGDIGSVAMNRRIFKEQTSDKGEIPFFKIGTFGGTPDAFISRDIFEEYKSKYPYPEIGDILISASGSIGRTVEYTGKDEYFQDSNIVWVRHEGRIDNKFLKQFYSIVKWKGLEGSTIKRLYNKNILDTTINLPSLPEQDKIGTFFDKLDNAIALHHRKVSDYQKLKDALLKQMFI